MFWKSPRRVANCFATCAVGLFLLSTPLAQAQDTHTVYSFNIDAQTLGTALDGIVEKTGAQLFYPNELSSVQNSQAVIGSYTLDEALKLLLEGTNYKRGVTQSGVIYVLNAPKESQASNVQPAPLSSQLSPQTIPTPNYSEEEVPPTITTLETVTVTRYRQSLEKALYNKRQAISQLESIIAEDMGKFPDSNLAESIQRVPGVAISREGGEGRQITLRGLGPSFTRTTLNGMEVPASTDGLDSSGGLNTGRAFDFNVFASDLFSRVDVHKTTSASMEEGGIAGTVALFSPKPMDNHPSNLVIASNARYNNLTGQIDPSLFGLWNGTYKDDKLGFLLSASYSDRSVRQEGFGTVRWTTPIIDGSGPFPSEQDVEVIGTPSVSDCADSSETIVSPINCLWFPRLPRPDFFGNSQTRSGLTGSFQYHPNDQTKLTIDTLMSSLINRRNNYNFFEFFLSSFNEVQPTSIQIADNGKQVEAASFDNVESFVESRKQDSDTEFFQLVANIQHRFTDSLSIDALIGSATSNSHREEYRYYMRSIPHSYSFDFSDNANVPDVSYGYDFNDASNFSLIDGRLSSSDVLRNNTTARIDATLDLDILRIKSGLSYNKRTTEYQVAYISDFPDQDSASGFTQAFPYNRYGFKFDGPLFPFTVANIDKINAVLLTSPFVKNYAQSWQTHENTLAAFLELQAALDLNGMPLRVNSGARIVETRVKSEGFTQSQQVMSRNSYTNLLPSASLSLDTSDNWTLRASYARNMTRPSFNFLNPGNPAFGYNTGTVVTGNPYLLPSISADIDFSVEWYPGSESLVSFNIFNKEIKSLIEISESRQLIDPIYYSTIEADPEYDPNVTVDFRTVPYLHITPSNEEGGTLRGIEVIYQQPFSILPSPFDNFGATANYTYVKADNKITGLSENSYNFTLYYEEPQFGGRISINTRDDYIIRLPGENGNLAEGKNGQTQVDVSAFYNLNDKLKLTFEIVNLTDEYERIYGTGDGTLNLPREYNHTGAQYLLGLRIIL
ncbi:TonB-dependent receptor [Hirschia baltica]|uniref:TonB-dependent receptor n=1 Tax=Hirschia baltica (strain ATCC 49814 / DSM 5838 / IFAM 1418) TaxID=582402 RepID=C6XPN0_HIRBI|nr:TonB-dependent receptor [Hirschia baltica]ACT60295.1 TonB-dependent receptor [Hirschia baltica ATCC 49814]